jgi:hypothetical protein
MYIYFYKVYQNFVVFRNKNVKMIYQKINARKAKESVDFSN